MPSYALNATQSGMITNSIGTPGLVLLILVIGAFALFMTIILPNQKWFDDMIDAIIVVVNSFKYAIVGVLTLIVGYMLYLVCNVIADSVKGVDPIWYVYIIGGYMVLTAVGAIVIRIVELLTQMYARYVESKKQKEIVA